MTFKPAAPQDTLDRTHGTSKHSLSDSKQQHADSVIEPKQASSLDDDLCCDVQPEDLLTEWSRIYLRQLRELLVPCPEKTNNVENLMISDAFDQHDACVTWLLASCVCLRPVLLMVLMHTLAVSFALSHFVKVLRSRGIQLLSKGSQHTQNIAADCINKNNNCQNSSCNAHMCSCDHMQLGKQRRPKSFAGFTKLATIAAHPPKSRKCSKEMIGRKAEQQAL